MTTVSASTLSRRAAQTKNPALAKRYRAQAAKLRREQRLAKTTMEIAASPRPMNGLPDREQLIEKIRQETASKLNQALYGDGRTMRAASVDHTPLANAPGHGEVVGGYLASMADELAELARKKGGVDAIQGRLMTLEHQTRHDAKFEMRERERKAVQAVREEMRDRAVCGFIAKFDASHSRDAVPSAAIMSSEEIRNLVDALKANGYTAVGKL